MGSSKIRSFLAIEIDIDLIAKIQKIQNELKNINANIKYIEEENMHFTLKFFGEITEDMIEEISIAIKETIANHQPINLSIKGTGTFPNENNIKVLWVGITNNQDLINLQKDLDEKFNELGFKKEKSYIPHLTIGRMKNPKNKSQVKKILDSFKDIGIGNMKIAKLYLKKSELTPNGPIYSDIAVFNL
ncbi:2',5' RNA ligase family [Methanobrevibacter cuticularis]|uniref:RNA 2',3'-cyclic phosphodiesterase n=1 Tax=Methanobrevibacter cuticularis TaxID=47311 RepID=A0A166EXK4_9EURY|nr:RNA 2',3'-cyclic phosphodiesterase [Methanobrevibacter cuticularis]KZX17119.1 2',5' RNA ligase family [Methanobrevibacter cuticularis]